ncbi:hypothetical protein BOTBODRAFT_35677 [Botryobasidium botryosum FD-172 SS1]|uniref:Hypervirulence associated protein TUDOR domain-containing protein n=1 Tax=Botryobasidium botryosum (strain FD-172 SS1) TaxID=930990 RepID=A0A067MHT9_BOTB1|nr:hypothetical protein BOTBODRAFT_35677 [Botryobasidium botryosum FD-172 SS1]
MSEIQEGDRVKYAPFHQAYDPKASKSQSTGEVTHVNEKPKKNDPEHKTYTILNDNTGKETTYGERSITEVLDE